MPFTQYVCPAYSEPIGELSVDQRILECCSLPAVRPLVGEQAREFSAKVLRRANQLELPPVVLSLRLSKS